MYRYHTPSGDKSMDGLAMALRLGLPLRDMEMVQFHPTGLLAGPDTRMTGTVLEEGLRGAGGHLLNGAQASASWATAIRELERATRDFVVARIYAEMRAGRTTPQRRRLHQDGPPRARARCARSSRAWWSAAPIAASIWPAGWWRWCRRRTISWAAWCAAWIPRPSWPGLFVAGEDAGGVHGANRLGGNGVANSTVFGGIAGETMAAWMARQSGSRAPDEDVLGAEMARAQHPFARKARRPQRLARAAAGRHVGRRRRDARRGRAAARLGKLDAIEGELLAIGVPTATAPSTSPGTTGSTCARWSRSPR